MRQVMALMWKEWRENLKYLVLGLVVFLGPSLLYMVIMSGNIGISERQQNGVDPILAQCAGYTMTLGLAFGGLFSILVAVGSVCRDFQGALDTFWRSRPLSLHLWVGAKCLGGASVLFLQAVATLLYLTYCYNGWSWLSILLAPVSIHLMYVFLLYFLAFLLAVLIRNATRAAILSIAGGLILYFLPLVFPPLSGLSILELSSGSRKDLILISQIFPLVSISFIVLAGVAIWRDWRLNVDQRSMVWATGAVGLLLFSGAAFQVGSNLECERIIPLNESIQRAVHIAAEGDRGVIGSYIQDDFADPANTHLRLRTFDFSGGKYEIGPEMPVELGRSESMNKPKPLWNPKQPEWVYLVWDVVERVSGSAGKTELTNLDLCVISMRPGRMGIISRVDLRSYLPDVVPTLRQGISANVLEDRIYIHDYNNSIIIDISGPASPVIMNTLPGISGDSIVFDSTSRSRPLDSFELSLPAYPDLTPEQKIAITMEGDFWARARDLDGQTMAFQNYTLSHGLSIFQLQQYDEQKAFFKKLGQRQMPTLETLFNAGGLADLILSNGLVYELFEGYIGGLTAYDIRDSSHIRRVGHYAAPNERFGAMHVLPDGRILLAGQNLHVVKPPRMK